MLEITIGSRKMTPPRMLRIVPFGERYISFRPNSSTRASSGVIVAHLTPTPCALDRFRGFDRDPVFARVAALDPEVEVDELEVEVGKDQLLFDERPDDPGHLVAVELDDRVLDLDLLRHRRGDAIDADNRGRWPPPSASEHADPRGLQPAAAAGGLQLLRRRPRPGRGAAARGRRLGRGEGARAGGDLRLARRRSAGASRRTSASPSCAPTTATATASTRSSSTAPGTN